MPNPDSQSIIEQDNSPFIAKRVTTEQLEEILKDLGYEWAILFFMDATYSPLDGLSTYANGLNGPKTLGMYTLGNLTIYERRSEGERVWDVDQDEQD